MSRTAIYTRNEKEYNEAMKILDNLGYRWHDGDSCIPEWKPAGGVNKLIYLILHSGDKTITINTIGEEPEECENIVSLKEFMGQLPLPFTKADLEDGMIMKTRDGRYYMYFKKFNTGVRYEGFISIDEYNDDLTYDDYYSYSHDKYDIVAVYSPKNLTTLDFELQIKYCNLIWKRPEKVRMTIKEIEEKLGIKNLEIIEEEEKLDE